MPALFLASATASAASILDLVSEEPRASRITFSFGTVGRLAELAAAYAMEANSAALPRVGLPFKQGVSGALWKAATVLTAVSLVLSAVPGKSRARRKWSGALGALGSLCVRLAVHYAGAASARDPRASFEPQRLGLPAPAIRASLTENG